MMNESKSKPMKFKPQIIFLCPLISFTRALADAAYMSESSDEVIKIVPKRRLDLDRNRLRSNANANANENMYCDKHI